jgi:hypothetical protein
LFVPIAPALLCSPSALCLPLNIDDDIDDDDDERTLFRIELSFVLIITLPGFILHSANFTPIIAAFQQTLFSPVWDLRPREI